MGNADSLARWRSSADQYRRTSQLVRRRGTSLSGLPGSPYYGIDPLPDRRWRRSNHPIFGGPKHVQPRPGSGECRTGHGYARVRPRPRASLPEALVSCVRLQGFNWSGNSAGSGFDERLCRCDYRARQSRCLFGREQPHQRSLSPAQGAVSKASDVEPSSFSRFSQRRGRR